MFASPQTNCVMEAGKGDVIILFIAAFRMGKWITTRKPVRAAAERHSEVLFGETQRRGTESEKGKIKCVPVL